MKLLHLSPVLCAFLVACSASDTTESGSTAPNADSNTMKNVSFTPDKGATGATDPKTGTVNPFGDKKDSGPATRIVERTGIDPKTKTVKIGAGGVFESKTTADSSGKVGTPGTRKATKATDPKTKTVGIGKSEDGKGGKHELIADPSGKVGTPGTRKATKATDPKTKTVGIGCS